jgi:cytochrome c oxidase cbb3-type subunit III
MKRVWLISFVLVALYLPACKREERAFHPGSAVRVKDPKSDFEQNAYLLSEGKRLFAAYNCNGCHSMGGGGMGPALMDDKWIYGGKAEEIFTTINDGRPNGMPSFRDRVPDSQIWQLAAYVRSMNGQLRKDAAPTRDDHLQGRPPESMTKQKTE